MTTHTLRSLFVLAVGGLAVLIAAYTGSAWASVAPCSLFAFVAFPRWRTKFYRLLNKLVARRDRCTPPD